MPPESLQNTFKNVQVGNDEHKRRGGKKTKMTIGTYTKRTHHKPSEQLFPNRQPLRYPNLTKNMKTYIRLKQYKNSTPNHKTIRTTTELSPWNDQ